MFKRTFLKALSLLIILTSAALYAQTPKLSIVQDIINQVNSDSAVYFVKELSGVVSTVIGGQPYTILSRNKSQPGNDKAAQYIKEKLTSYGYSAVIQSFSSTCGNVMGTKTGTQFPNKKFIICAHFDDMPSGTTAPGADDNGSGTAGVLEAARVLKNYSFPFTIVFALWDEEEQGLIGSDYFAAQAAAAGDSILGVVNMDMIAWESNNDNHVNIHTRPIANSMDLCNKMVEVNSMYQIGLVPVIKNPGINASDHASFWDANYSAILLIEDDDNDFNQYYHTVNDKLQYYNIPFFKKNIQLALGTFATLALNLNILISHTPIASTLSTQPIPVNASIQSGLTIGAGTAAPRLYYRTKQTGGFSAFSAVSGTTTGGGNYSFTIPAQQLGTLVQYYIAAQDSGGAIVASSPKGASGFNPPGSTPPTTFHSFFVAPTTIVFADSAMNMQSWTATGTWGLTTAKYVSPPNSFTDSPGGLYPSSVTTTLTMTNGVNLGAVLGAYMEFDTQFDLESGYDYVQFNVTTDNGVTWKPMTGLYTKPGSGSFQPSGQPLYNGTQTTWVREKIDLTEFAGKTIKVRFYFKSDGSIQKDGIYIDNLLLSAFTSQPVGWDCPLSVADNASNTKNLTFGQKAGATDGIDTQLGEIDLPPPPPTGVMDARFILPSNVNASMIDYRDTSKTSITWKLTFQPGGSYPMTFTWNSAALTRGTFFLKDIITGSIVNVDMRQNNSYTLTNTGITALQIVFTLSTCKDVALASGWNMVSVPVAAVDMSGAALFPQANSLFYGFDNGYQSVTTLVNGKGYWVRYPSSAVANICGMQLGQTVPLIAGWNLIGVYANDVPVSALTTTPSGIVNSQYYGYTGGYFVPTTLVSGKGYWVRTIQSGTLNLPAALKVSAQNYTVQQYGGKIIISDAAGNSTVLYALNSPQAGYDLPPVPPQSSSIGGFDVRFDGDKMADVLSSAKDIRVNSAVYPVTIRVEGAVITLRDKATAGKILNQTISSGQSAQINDASVNVIEIHASEKPTVYELSQNYPNPFNPSTVISYQIPVSGMVTLKVYDAIGSEVVTLVNNIQDAGSYNVTFNANKLNSGVYFYTLRAGEYSATKKLILLK